MPHRQPHAFKPPKHGARDACAAVVGTTRCGARLEDPVHKAPPKPPSWPRRGQLVVEMALLLPVLLLLLLGIMWVGLASLMAYQLNHAATEGAVAGATHPGDPCGVALVTARRVYGLPLDDATCTEQAQVLVVTLTDSLGMATPWATDLAIVRTARAAPR